MHSATVLGLKYPVWGASSYNGWMKAECQYLTRLWSACVVVCETTVVRDDIYVVILRFGSFCTCSYMLLFLTGAQGSCYSCPWHHRRHTQHCPLSQTLPPPPPQGYPSLCVLHVITWVLKWSWTSCTVNYYSEVAWRQCQEHPEHTYVSVGWSLCCTSNWMVSSFPWTENANSHWLCVNLTWICCSDNRFCFKIQLWSCQLTWYLPINFGQIVWNCIIHCC